MYIRKANDTDISELIELHIMEQSEAGNKSCDNKNMRQLAADVLNRFPFSIFVVIEDNHIVSVCYCIVYELLPFDDKGTRFYKIVDICTQSTYRRRKYEEQLISYVKCEMEHNKIRQIL